MGEWADVLSGGEKCRAVWCAQKQSGLQVCRVSLGGFAGARPRRTPRRLELGGWRWDGVMLPLFLGIQILQLKS